MRNFHAGPRERNIFPQEMADGVNSPKKLNDFLRKQKEQHDNMNMKFNWPELCKYIPKCILYRASQLRQIAIKGLGKCTYKTVDEFLMFAVELLIDEDRLTNEQFTMLQEKAGGLTLEDAQTMLDVIKIIREKFNECVSTNSERNVNENEECGVASNVTSASNPFGLVFQSTSATTSNSQVLHTVPMEKTDRRAGYSSLKRRNEETKPLATNPIFDKATYEEKVTAYYEKHSPVISRQAFNDNVIDILQSDNSESELIDFIGCEALDFVEYIVQNRQSIIALNPDCPPRKKAAASALIQELVTLMAATEQTDLWKDVEKLMTKYVAGEKRKRS